MTSYATGTTNSHQRTNPKDIMNFECIIPPFHKMHEFDRIGRLGLVQNAETVILRNKAEKQLAILSNMFRLS